MHSSLFKQSGIEPTNAVLVKKLIRGVRKQMKNMSIGTALTVALPDNFEVFEEEDGVMAAFPAGDETITIRFDHLTFRPRPPIDNPALLYVKESAKQSGRALKLYGDKNVTEYEESVSEDGESLLIKYWEVALDKRLAILSATFPADQKEQPAVSDVLNAIPAMIESLAATPAK
jgi:hypothetical protein